MCVCVRTHVLATDLLLSELHLYQRSDGGEELPPWPAFDTTVLLYVLLDAADGQMLDLSNTENISRRKNTIHCIHCEKAHCDVSFADT